MKELRTSMSPAEWQARVDLAACYRLVALFGWDDLIYSRISARVPDEPEHFLLNPFGMMFEEVTASSLLKVNREGYPLEKTPQEFNPEGFTPLIALHDARANANCVLHTHSLHGAAVAAQKNGLLPITQHALIDVGTHEYEGYPLREEEKVRMRERLGQRNALILQNHGLVTVGETVAQAFLVMQRLETACQMQILAQSGGSELLHIPTKVFAYIHSEARINTANTVGPRLAWDGLLRRLDRIYPGYRL